MKQDELIIEQIQKGDMAAFNKLFNATYLSLYVYCRKFVSDPETAKDLMQNVFLRFWERKEDIDIHTSLNSYLYRSVHNECLNYLRVTVPVISGKEHSEETVLDFSDKYATPDIHYTAEEIKRLTQETITQLPGECQRIYNMSRIKGMKNKEIADKLNISVRTVETQIYRALKALKIKLKDYLV